MESYRLNKHKKLFFFRFDSHAKESQVQRQQTTANAAGLRGAGKRV